MFVVFAVNQSDANVSVVRVGQVDGDESNSDLTLTVDPPPFVPSESGISNAVHGSGTATDATALVDPFMEMDPEQLEKLGKALQSDEAKQILGENVTAMLGLLTLRQSVR